MKTRFFIFSIPLLFLGFLFSDDSCRQAVDPSIQADGPYVLYKNGKVFVHTVMEENNAEKLHTDSFLLDSRDRIILEVASGENGNLFHFPLQKEINNQPAEYPQPGKMFILSDIEGNFSGFRKLLLAGSVIDSSFNWTFGAGHLVLIGDFVDRGKQVNEVLWLIYSLEEKAKAAGGYVHYILGNHEIMNLSGDLRYVQPKYLKAASLIKVPFTRLYGEASELGRWLRTKNVVEKIGDILFTHGGISATVNHLNIPVQSINELSRPYYADSTYTYKDPRTDSLFSEKGPFWYRGYYTDSSGRIPSIIDTTLSIYQVKHIATGHTIIADTISRRFSGHLFNTDVHHASGKSEALYFDGTSFYRVKADGTRILFTDTL
jgi:hypothetical protein